MLRWRDGTRMPLSALGLGRDGQPLRRQGKPASDRLVAATEAISSIDYEPIYLKMYGDCRKADMGSRLATVLWNRGAAEGPVELRAARANGVAAAMQRVSDVLDRAAGKGTDFHRATGGTFNCRTIADTDRLSLHGFGIAIDVAPNEEGTGRPPTPTPRDGRSAATTSRRRSSRPSSARASSGAAAGIASTSSISSTGPNTGSRPAGRCRRG